MDCTFHNLVKKGDVRSVKTFLNEREKRGRHELSKLLASRDPFGNTPLHYAAEGRHDVAHLLLSFSDALVASSAIDARNHQGSTPLHQAAFGNSYQCVRLLLKHGAFVDATDYDGSTPLHHGAANNAAESVMLLLESGANIEAKDQDGCTPLHHAAFNNSVDVLRRLIKAGSAIQVRTTNEGTTPLHLATFGGYSLAAQLLLDAGSDIQTADNDGATPLHKAAYQGSAECVKLLLERGAAIDHRDVTLSTPLHMAAYRGHLNCVEILVRSGAQTSLANKHGRTPLKLAIAKCHRSCAEFLEKIPSSPASSSSSVPSLSSPSASHSLENIGANQLELIDILVSRHQSNSIGGSGSLSVPVLPSASTSTSTSTPASVSTSTSASAKSPSAHQLTRQWPPPKPQQENGSHGPQKSKNTISGSNAAMQQQGTTKKNSSITRNNNKKSSSSSSSTSNDKAKERGREEEEEEEVPWAWSNDDSMTVENGWIFDCCENGATVSHPEPSAEDLTKSKTLSQSNQRNSRSEKKKKKKEEKKKQQAQTKEEKRKKRAEKKELNLSANNNKRKLRLADIGRTGSLANFHLSPRGLFSGRTSAAKRTQATDKIQVLDLAKIGKNHKSNDTPTTPSSWRDASEGEGEAATRSTSSSDDSEDNKFAEKNIDVARLDKYGFFKDEMETPEVTLKRRGKEARMALKWTKVIQNWDKQSQQKKLPKLQDQATIGIPDCVRGTVWKLIVGAPSMQQQLGFKYSDLCAKAHNTKDGRQIDLDIKRTYRNHFMFRDKKGIGQKALSNILKAYSIFNEEIGYCQGMADLTALLVMYMEEEEAWWTIVALIQRYAMAGLFTPSFPRLFQCFHVHNQLLQRHLPYLYNHFVRQGIEAAMYATKWYMNIFLGSIPFPVVLRVWDMYLWGGPHVVYRFALAVLKYFESTLLALNFEDALSFINELPKKKVHAEDLVKMYKKMQAAIKDWRIQKLEQDYAAANKDSSKFLVGSPYLPSATIMMRPSGNPPTSAAVARPGRAGTAGTLMASTNLSLPAS